MDEEIPIHDNEEKSVEVDENFIEDSEIIDDDDDNGNINVTLYEERNTELTLGDLYLFVLESVDDILLGKIVSIEKDENRLTMECDNNKNYIFIYDENEIISKTDDYEIIEIVRVIEYEPDNSEISLLNDYTLETDIEEDKKYSKIAIKDNLLSVMIESMNIYENSSMIEKVQKTIDTFYEMIESGKIIQKDNQIPKWLVPLISDNIKYYHDLIGVELSAELQEYENSMKTVNNYSDYLSVVFNSSKVINTENGYGYTTNEYSGTFLRNCIQDDSCSGLGGEPYSYDERRNSNSIKNAGQIVHSCDVLRFVAMLIEPIDKTTYSFDEITTKDYTVFEKTIYSFENRMNQMKKKKSMKKSLIEYKEIEDYEISDNYTILNLSDKSDINEINRIKESVNDSLLENLIDSEIVKSIYNLSDLRKVLWKYNINTIDFNPDKVKNLFKIIQGNIRKYCIDYVKMVKKIKEEKFETTKLTLNKEDLINKILNYILNIRDRQVYNHYLDKFIRTFTRRSEKITEDNKFLYSKISDKKILCTHYLYKCEIDNSNSLFDKMKDKFGNPPEDGSIFCKYCGEYLCEENPTLFDGYEGEKPSVSSEVLDSSQEKKLEIEKYITDNEELCNIINLLSTSIGVSLEDDDIYNILLVYKYIDHNRMADLRYDLNNVTTSDIHPRINKTISDLKEKEKSEKDKKQKKGFKLERENIVKNFQGWIIDTNKVLVLSSILSIFIQTKIPSLFLNNDSERTFQIIDIESKIIHKSALNYLSVKIRKLSEKYKDEKVWNNCNGLFNEKEFDTNEIDIQLANIIQFITQPNFPKIFEKLKQYDEFIKAEKHQYLKEEWPLFRPLKKNIINKEISDILRNNYEKDKKSYVKKYGGICKNNSALLRTLGDTESVSLSEILDIPGLSIYKNSSFKVLFRYVVSLYGVQKSNAFMTLSFRRLLNTSDEKDKLHRIFVEHGWNEDSDSFPKLDFKMLRTKLFPKIFGLYGDNSEIKSCFKNIDSCNHYIHNTINTYDLHLLNTNPKRVYFYNPIEAFPKSEFNLLKEERMEYLTNLFSLYRYDENDKIIKMKENKLYDKYKIHISENINTDLQKYKDIDINEENYLLLINYLIAKNKMIYNSIEKSKIIYKESDYALIDTYPLIYGRLLNYLNGRIFSMDESNQNLYLTLFSVLDIIYRDDYDNKDLIMKNYREIYSTMLSYRNLQINKISTFFTRSINIQTNQKKRFITLFKQHNSSKVNFVSDDLITLLKLYINDDNLNYSYIERYITHIRNVLSLMQRDIFKPTSSSEIPKKRWKMSDVNYSSFTNHIDRENTHIDLYFHENLFQRSNPSLIGFNRYFKEYPNAHIYFSFLYDNISVFLKDIENMKGYEGDEYYNEKNMNIVIKYHFLNIFTESIKLIEDLNDNTSEAYSMLKDIFSEIDTDVEFEEFSEESSSVLSQFLIDIFTDILYKHYDPNWIFLNEKRLDLSNRISKQKEREKQYIVEKLTDATKDERYAQIQKQKMGITLYYHMGAEKANEYIQSDEYNQDNMNERYDKIKEIMASYSGDTENLFVDQENNPVLPSVPINDEEVGCFDIDDFDEESEYSMYGMFDEEQENSFNI